MPVVLRDELASIGEAMRRLASTKQPWPQMALDDVRAIAGRIVARATSEPVDRAAVAGSLLHTSALDLIAVAGDNRMTRELLETRSSVPAISKRRRDHLAPNR